MQTNASFPDVRPLSRPLQLVRIFRLPAGLTLEPLFELECRLADNGVVVFSGPNIVLVANLQRYGIESFPSHVQVFPSDGEKFLRALVTRPFGYHYAVPVIE